MVNTATTDNAPKAFSGRLYIMIKFIVTTLGCKVNQAESESIIQTLIDTGWEKAKKRCNADICIINTCAVTKRAAMQSRQAIRKLIKSNPNAKIIVTGCYAQTGFDELKKIREIEYIVGHNNKHKIAEVALNLANDVQSIPFPVIPDNNECKETIFHNMSATKPGTRTRPFLKIQDGCNAFCNYCIVPYARGRSRSMHPQDIIDNLHKLKESGHKEVVLTGIHVGCYGLDLFPKTDLFQLLKTIDQVKPINYIRLSSIEPKEITDDIIQLVARSKTICKHFHIPLQSGDNEILKKMGRPYNREIFKEIVLKIKKYIPEAAIGVDTLIGFPGETNAQFENTYSIIKELPVTYLHVFPFSPRNGTPAASYPGQVNADIIKKRCAKMRKLGQLKRDLFYSSFVGKQQNIIIEHKRDRETGLLKGITTNYATVLFNGDDSLKNKIISINIEKSDENYLYGKI